MRSTGWWWVLLATAVLWVACSQGPTRVVVAAGTTLVDGGLLGAVAADYETEHSDVQLSVVAASTARVLALAEGGSADVTITHDPEQEERFLALGGAELAAQVFSSRFVLAGPPSLVQELEGLSPVQAFQQIARREYTFVSRADGSGTYQRERRIWDEAETDPRDWPWYVQTRQGMGLTLQVASQRQGFVLVEWSVFLNAGEVIELVEAPLDPVGLANPYRAMAVKGSPVVQEAVDFVLWLESSQGQSAIRRANQELYGLAVFSPGPDSR